MEVKYGKMCFLNCPMKSGRISRKNFLIDRKETYRSYCL
jgi:hypothetical protein